MLLAIDVGNTQITGGLFDGEKLVFQFRRTTNMGTSSDEIGIFFRTVIRENGFDCNKMLQRSSFYKLFSFKRNEKIF